MKDVRICDLDEEWVNLILEAKNMGITIQEIQTFFSQATARKENSSMIPKDEQQG
ncbi:anti-repressor SinI family protein [Ectobacillus polymachus]|uniref:anti-repressor SinI family protein n=1 Tax=Ectobacillus polymachus TaxID=1508806 RepID=UPI003A8C225E